MSGRRPARRTNHNISPDPSLFVGYVEDGESVAAIMKKFEELERIQSNTDEPLNEEQLRQVFMQTSAFTVESAQLVASGAAFDYDDEFLWSFPEHGEEEPMEEETDECEEFLKEAEEPLTIVKTKSEPFKKVRLSKESKPTISEPKKLPPKQVKISSSNRQSRKIDHDTTTTTIVLRLPDPIPRSWAHLIERPPISTNSSNTIGKRVSFDFMQKNNDDLVEKIGVDWFGVLMDPPFCESYGPFDQFSKMTLPKRMKNGMLFIWVETEFLASVIEVATSWGFNYVENVAWIRKAVNNTFSTRKGPIFGSTHSSLLVFRKTGDNQTIRHQRNPDCIFDFVKPSSLPILKIPKDTFNIIEEMLPDAINSSRLLYLWAPPNVSREGWTFVCQRT